MYITKIDNSRKNVFFAAMPEQKIIEGIQGIIRKKEFPIVSQKMDYFVDMQKGSKINPDRKLEINVDEYITNQDCIDLEQELSKAVENYKQI